MRRGARTGLGSLGAALVVVAVLCVTGVVRLPFLRSASDAGPAAVRRDARVVPVGTSSGELAAGSRRKLEASAEIAPAEPVLPSVAKGTATGAEGGTIRGRVVEAATKRPVSGATVELLMPEPLFHYLRASPVGRFDRLTAMTDAAGRFEFTSVRPAKDYALRARATAGPWVTREGLTLSARDVLDAGDLVLGPSGGLSGRIVGADGKVLAGARVAITWAMQNHFDAILADPDTLPWVESIATTGSDGTWKAEGLEPGVTLTSLWGLTLRS